MAIPWSQSEVELLRMKGTKKDVMCLCMHACMCMFRQRLGTQDFALSSLALRLKVLLRVTGWRHLSCCSPWTWESCSQEPSTMPRFALQMFAPSLLVVPTVLRSYLCGSWAQGSRTNPWNSSGRISWASWSTEAEAASTWLSSFPMRTIWMAAGKGCLEP